MQSEINFPDCHKICLHRKSTEMFLQYYRILLLFAPASILRKVDMTTKRLNFQKSFPPKARWPSGRVSDSGARGRGSILTQVAILCIWARYIYLQKVIVFPRKRWLRPDMTENDTKFSSKTARTIITSSVISSSEVK